MLKKAAVKVGKLKDDANYTACITCRPAAMDPGCRLANWQAEQDETKYRDLLISIRQAIDLLSGKVAVPISVTASVSSLKKKEVKELKKPKMPVIVDLD